MVQRKYFSKANPRITKSDMARVIICARYNMPELPAADDMRVKRTSRQPMASLSYPFELAHKIIAKRKTETEPEPASSDYPNHVIQAAVNLADAVIKDKGNDTLYPHAKIIADYHNSQARKIA